MTNISSEQMQQYILAARTRQQQRLAKLDQHRKHGFEVARLAAQILKTEFSASRVVIFGSLLSEHSASNALNLITTSESLPTGGSDRHAEIRVPA